MHSRCGVDDDSLSGLEDLDSRVLDGRLITEEGSEGGLDEPSSEGKNDDRDDERSNSVTSSDDRRDGRDDQKDMGEGSDGGSDADGLRGRRERSATRGEAARLARER